MPRMLKHPKKQDHIERSHRFRGKGISVNFLILYLRSEGLAGKFKSFLRSPSGPTPSRILSCENTAGASFFCFKRKKAVPTANIKDALALNPMLKCNICHHLQGVATQFTVCYCAISQVYRVKLFCHRLLFLTLSQEISRDDQVCLAYLRTLLW